MCHILATIQVVYSVNQKSLQSKLEIFWPTKYVMCKYNHG